MNRVRKMVNGNKGFITFWLVLFFLTAGLAKSIVSFLPSDAKKEINTNNAFYKHVLTAKSAGESSLSFIDQLKDTDSDDFEFAFFGNHFDTNFLPPVAKKQNNIAFVSYNAIYSGQLYDLYCNWKFHLS